MANGLGELTSPAALPVRSADKSRVLRVNPALVVWPGQELAWFLIRETGDSVSPPFVLPPSSVRVLHAFLEPRGVPADPSPELHAALAMCTEHGLLVDAGASDFPAVAAERWLGFRFADHKNVLGTAPVLRRQTLLGGRPVTVYDGVVTTPVLQSLQRWMLQLAYRRIDVDSSRTVHARHWICHLNPPQDVTAAVPAFTWLANAARASGHTGDMPLRRLHAYSTQYGDVLREHHDVESGTGTTAMLYANTAWQDHWMGETVFYEGDEPAAMVAPRPGRMVVFDGRILHRGGAPSRECHEARYTLVFKFSV